MKKLLNSYKELHGLWVNNHRFLKE
jgi:hypothetical protein